jgi:hypothetical protein
VAHPEWRASSVGVYRLWRDGGYAVGALMAGLLADTLGLAVAIAAIGGLTFVSGVVVAGVMVETLPARRRAGPHSEEGSGVLNGPVGSSKATSGAVFSSK